MHHELTKAQLRFLFTLTEGVAYQNPGTMRQAAGVLDALRRALLAT